MDKIINPSHYHSDYEWKDFARKYQLFGNFFNFKYLVRAGKKENVPEVQDWQKFKQFMNFELNYIMQLVKNGRQPDYLVPYYFRNSHEHHTFQADCERFCKANNITGLKETLFYLLMGCLEYHSLSRIDALVKIKTNLQSIIWACDTKIMELENGEN